MASDQQSVGARPRLAPAGFAAVAALAGLLLLTAAPAAGEDEYAEPRRQMLEAVRALVSETARQTGVEALDEDVADALAAVPRHRFVPRDRRHAAYLNRPLPIGHGQTISQPYIVALMTQLLQPEPGDRVFELGTGSGYQAAVLAEMDAEVYSVEIVPELAERASSALAAAGDDGVAVRNADGYHGWPEHAPFDAIVVTAAADHVPPPLVDQLAPGGRLILPLGDPFGSQALTVVRKGEDGEVSSRQVLPVRFVPLTRGGP